MAERDCSFGGNITRQNIYFDLFLFCFEEGRQSKGVLGIVWLI